ncbi:hypothetical protein NQ317_018750 [Molorchus minor]|uniref:Uncharacterized protein n=1 Tax=Molorchus minor TaxID=1323400 RepID=A0ABQ9JD74_9CUCU|nr:hypothetical protein NQ317_018750 [Molorchus minor]
MNFLSCVNLGAMWSFLMSVLFYYSQLIHPASRWNFFSVNPVNRSPRHSIVPPEGGCNRSPRGSIAPESLCVRTSPRGSIASEYLGDRSPRGSIGAGENGENRSPRGSIVKSSLAMDDCEKRSPRGSLTLTFQGAAGHGEEVQR